MNNEIVSNIILHTRVNILYDIYNQEDKTIRSLVDIFNDYNIIYCKLNNSFIISILCDKYYLDRVSTFKDFINAYDRVYLFKKYYDTNNTNSITQYRIDRYKYNYNTLEALSGACDARDLLFINYVLDTELLWCSPLHMIILAKGLCYNVNLLDKYLQRYVKFESRNNGSRITIYPYGGLIDIAYCSACVEEYDVQQYFDLKIESYSSNPMYALVSGRWDLLDKMDDRNFEDVTLEGLLIDCDNYKLLSNTDLVPEHIRCKFKDKLSRTDTIHFILDQCSYKLFKAIKPTQEELFRDSIGKAISNDYTSSTISCYQILSICLNC